MIDHLYFIYKGLITYNGRVSEIDGWFEKYGLVTSNSLSKPEFLFELFTRRSVFKEVMAYDPVIEKMISEKEKEAEAAYGDCRLYSGTDSTVKYGFNLNHIWNLMKKGLIFTFRGTRIFGVLFRYALFTGLASFIFNLMIKELTESMNFRFSKEISGLKTNNNDNVPLNEIYKFLCSKPGVDKDALNLLISYKSIFAFIFTIPILISLVFPNASGFSSRNYVAREVAKSTYSIVSYYVAVLCSEFLLEAVKCHMVLAILLIFKMTFLLGSFYFIFSLFSPFIFGRFFLLMFKLIAESGFVFYICMSLNFGLTLLLFLFNYLSELYHLTLDNSPFKLLRIFCIGLYFNPLAFFMSWFIQDLRDKRILINKNGMT